MPLMEQPEDWTEPGAHPVSANVHRVPLPLPFDGLHAVNVYVIEDPHGLIVVDSGWAMPDTEKALAGALRELGHQLDDVAEFVVTHVHNDHYTQALALRKAFGTRVRIGRGEQRSIEGFDQTGGSTPQQLVHLRRCGAAELAERMATMTIEVPDTTIGPPDAWLDDGERITLHDRTLDVFATPGHTGGHIVLRDAAHGLLFSGDHVLPHITPSIGLEPVPQAHPLRSYLASLRLVRDMPDALLLPAHGPAAPSVHTRIDELLAHHEQRLTDTLATVRAGAETAYQAAGRLPWTRRRRRLDELAPMHQLLAVLETDAHLDVLVDQGQLVSAEHDGVRRYATA